MKSLIILRGLSKHEKTNWIRKERLNNFLVDLDLIKTLYYKPEFKGGRDFLTRSLDDVIYKRAIEILINRMGGSLVVLDWEQEQTTSIELLAKVMGYTVFYKIFPVPADFETDLKKYHDFKYIPKSREQIKKIVEEFKAENYSNKHVISTFRDVENYWKNEISQIKVKSGGTVLHISDIHSHWSLVEDIVIPKISKNSLTIFLGDYIDGPEPDGSRKMMEYVLSCDNDSVIFLEGNHELRLRKYLGWKALRNTKKVLSEALLTDVPNDFMEQTSRQFDDLDAAESWVWINGLNKKLMEFCVYEKSRNKFICSHCGLRWVDQIGIKYLGNLLNTNKYTDRVDEFFSNKYSKEGIWSIHGHCHYLGNEVNKFPGVFNLDPPDEKKVLLLESKSNLKFNIRCLEQEEV